MRNISKILAVSALAVAIFFSLGATKSSQSSKYAWLGVTGQTVDDDLADAFDLSADHGAIVNQVLDDSPADEARFKEGDIIIDFDGQEIYGWDDLIDALEGHKPGDVVNVRVIRDDRERDLTVTLEGKPRHYRSKYRQNTYLGEEIPWVMVPDIPAIPAIPSIPSIPSLPNMSGHFYTDSDGGGYIGVSLRDLSGQLGEYFGVEKGRGALIVEVEDDSPAEEAGLKAGDVIVAADDEKIFDSEDVSEIIGDMDEGDKITLTILRDKKEQTIEVEVGEYDGYGRNSFRWVGPDIDITIPDMKGLHNGVYFDDLDNFRYFMDDDEYEDFLDEMKDYQEEMKDLQEEMRDLRFDHHESVQDDLDELREELQELKDRMD